MLPALHATARHALQKLLDAYVCAGLVAHVDNTGHATHQTWTDALLTFGS